MTKILLNILLATMFTVTGHAMMMDDPLLYRVMMDNLEKQDNDDKSVSWDANIWVGYDREKVYLYSEGEKPDHGKAESENQLVYSRAFAPFWDIQLGAGYDKAEDADHTWGVLALSGLAPYFFETRTALLIGEDGNVGLRLETEYEALLTQKLIASPSFSTAIYSKDTPEMELGRGMSNIKLGLRLRYEFTREFAPYLGIEWNKNFGQTNDYHTLDETYAIIGLRFWF